MYAVIASGISGRIAEEDDGGDALCGGFAEVIRSEGSANDVCTLAQSDEDESLLWRVGCLLGEEMDCTLRPHVAASRIAPETGRILNGDSF
jgi:hypothetical protein